MNQIRTLLRRLRDYAPAAAYPYVAAGRLHPADYPASWGGRVPIDGVSAPSHASRWQSATATTIGPSFRNVFGNAEQSPEEREQVNNYADYVATRGFVPSRTVSIPGWDNLSLAQQQRLLVAHNDSRLSEEKTRLRGKFRQEQDWVRRSRAATQQNAAWQQRVANDQRAERQRAADAASAQADASPKAPSDSFAWLPAVNAHLAQVAVDGRWSGTLGGGGRG